MSGKRKAATAATDESKRFRSALVECADEFICAITQELPIEPVTAEDGHIYEKKAIKQWLRQKASSPKTNQPMGVRLTPAVGVRNTIEKMVRSGALTGDKASAWLEKIETQEELVELQRKVEAGNVKAMLTLGDLYEFGMCGLEKNEQKALGLFQRAADAGSVAGLHALGNCYVYGWGVEPNETLGVHLVTKAAFKGFEESCYDLGSWFAEGSNGIPEDAKQAVEWYKKMTSCRVKECIDSDRATAAAYVLAHDATA